MNSDIPSEQHGGFSFSDAMRFWERQRLLYNLALAATTTFWMVISWPHFLPALKLQSLALLGILALLANLCYCAAYAAEPAIQRRPTVSTRARMRWSLWLVGTLFAILLTSYWINDEIYPDVGRNFTLAKHAMLSSSASNTNFPAPVAVAGFLGAFAFFFAALASAGVAWFARKPQFSRMCLLGAAGGGGVYFALLFGFSLFGHNRTLAPGEEKYFCEIDCHLAYSVVDVRTEPAAGTTHLAIRIRTRFDETTISASRPRDAQLTPSPRAVYLIDTAGRRYLPVAVDGAQLLTPLKPADSYVTEIAFDVPQNNLHGLRLLVATEPSWPDFLVIGDENSLLHHKTYFAVSS